jgi:predicted alpha/beta superfamily hydrolase
VSSGQLRKHEQFRSRFLRNQRDLIVYAPPGYAEQPSRRFPVLYLHDGQNLFDGATSFIPGQDWHVGQTADQCIQGASSHHRRHGNTKTRIREYTNPRPNSAAAPTAMPNYGRRKPFIDREYRTLTGSQYNGIGGSSLGTGFSDLGLAFAHF